MPTVKETVAFIQDAHAGQKDASGNDYYHHPMAVLGRMEQIAKRWAIPLTDDMKHAALLHDVLEDTPYTADDLRARGYSEETIAIVNLVGPKEKDASAPKGRTDEHVKWYRSKMEHIVDSGNIGAILLKNADNKENTAPERAAQLNETDAAWFAKKYAGIGQILEDGIREHVQQQTIGSRR